MIQVKRRLLFGVVGLFALMLSMAPICFAQVNAAPFLSAGAGARSLGLGGAFTAIADDATSTVWNPAGMPSVEDLTFTVSTARLSLDRKHNFIGAVKKLGETSAIGVSVINAGVDDIPRYSEADELQGEFNYSSNVFGVSYAYGLEKMSFGGSIGLLTDSFGLDDLDGSSKTGFAGISLGFLGHSLYSGEMPTVSYGATLRNLGGSIAGSSLPVFLNLGVAFRVLKKNIATFSFDLENEFVDLEESTTRVRLGVEYLIARTFAIRGGGVATRDRRSFFAGFGVNVSGLQLDYAFKPGDSTVHRLDNDETHYMSLSYSY